MQQKKGKRRKRQKQKTKNLEKEKRSKDKRINMLGGQNHIANQSAILVLELIQQIQSIFDDCEFAWTKQRHFCCQ